MLLKHNTYWSIRYQNQMKKTIFSAIFLSVSLFITAQDISLIVNENDNKEFTAAAVKQGDSSENNIISNITYTITDIDGNTYKAVKIGAQLWMAENLRTTRFNDGTDIPLASDFKNWSSLASPGYCWYSNNTEKYKTSYGALYNWYTVKTDKLCPAGWHVPSAEEWNTLVTNCGEKSVGGEMKAAGTKYWMSPNTGATNSSGFTALPGGSRGSLGSFLDEGLRGYWWSSTESDQNRAYYNSLGYSSNNATGNSDNKKGGLSVRCVKN